VAGSPASEPHRVQVTLTVGPNTIVVPAWLGGAVLLCFLLSTLTLLLFWNSGRETARELRLLQQDMMDVQATMIRSGIATRSDFMPPRATDATPDKKGEQ
jgi:hypothetical protein